MDQNQFKIRVQDTNAEALHQKISAIKKGYINDEFAEQFVRANQDKKDVIIHRGYWCRSHIFSRIVKEFLNVNIQQKKQIISIGSGYDTLPFQIISEMLNSNFHYYEIDLPQVSQMKVKKIDASEKIKLLFNLNDLFIDKNHQFIHSSKYTLFGQDLCQIDELMKNFKQFEIDFKIPTLIFAECVLTYIDTNSSSELLKNFASQFETLSFMNYEMFNGNDAFGQMMVKNFERRGCCLIGIDAFPSLIAHSNRLKQLGFLSTEIYDMRTLYKQGTQEKERLRIEKIEMLDEWEEWNIMQSHYFVSLSHNFSQKSQENIMGQLQNEIIERVKLRIN